MTFARCSIGRAGVNAVVAFALFALFVFFTLVNGADARAATFIVFNQTDDPVVAPEGSLREAIRELDLLGDIEENFIRFDLPTSAPVLLEDVLPDIERNVEIVADELFGGTVRKVDPEIEYDILRVARGTTMIDGVQFREGPITVGIDKAGITDAADARVGFRYGENVSVAFDQTITGLGGVIKEGLGELVLSGENDFAAGLFVLEGNAVVDAESLQANAEVEEDALLVFSNFDRDDETDDELFDEDFAFEVSGDGRVQKIGSHDLTLTGAGLLHAGGTEILEGSIIATPTRLPGDVDIGADANLVLVVASDEAWAGNATGDGAIDKQGTGTLTLDGEHTNTLGIFVGNGHVRGAAANLPPRVELSDTSTSLQIDQPTNASYDGLVTGAGPVQKTGAGTLTLTGANDYTGGTTVLQGRLRGTLDSIQGDVVVDPTLDGSSTLELVVDDTRTYSGALSGDGALVKSGNGRLVFDDPQPVRGATTISAGTLEVTSDGVLDGSVGGITVAQGATLTGEGQALGAIDVQGTLRPGNGLGTDLDANANVTLAASSTLAVDVQHDGGTSARSALLVGGTTTLDGGALDVTVHPGDYATTQVFSVIAGGAINENAPVSVVPLYAFVDVMAQPNGGNLDVSVTENGANAVTFATTRNQVEVATAIDSLITAGALDSEVQRSLVSVTVDDLPRVLDEMSAASLSVMFTQRIESGRRFSRAVSRRFTAARYEDSQPRPKRRAPKPVRRRVEPPVHDRKPLDRLHGPHRVTPPPPAPTTEVPPQPTTEPGDAAAPDTGTPSSPTTEPAETPSVDAGPAQRIEPPRNAGGKESGVGIWGDAFGVFGQVDGGQETDDVKTRLYGFTLGLDYRLRDGQLLPKGQGLRFGAAVDYGRAAPEGELGMTSTKANLVLVGGHVSWTRGPVYAGVVGRYGFMKAESSRRIVFGDIDATAVGEFDGNEGAVYTEAGARLDIGRNLLLQPRVGFEWTHLSQSAFDESGAPGLALAVDSASLDSLRTLVGMNLATQMTLRGRFGIEPELRVAWGFEAGDIDRLIDARLDGAAFSSIGAQTSRNEALIGAGYTMRVTRGLAIALDYDARIGAQQASHAIAASLHAQW